MTVAPACTAPKTGKHKSSKREAECPACGPKKPHRSGMFARPAGSIQTPRREPLMGELLYAMSPLTDEELQNPFVIEAHVQGVVDDYLERNKDKEDRGLSGFAMLDHDSLRTFSGTASTCWQFARTHIAFHHLTPHDYLASVIDSNDVPLDEFGGLGANPSLPEDLMMELVERSYEVGDVRVNEAVRQIAKRKPLPEKVALAIIEGTVSRDARESVVINETVSPRAMWEYFKSHPDTFYDEWWSDSLASNRSTDADVKHEIVDDIISGRVEGVPRHTYDGSGLLLGRLLDDLGPIHQKTLLAVIEDDETPSLTKVKAVRSHHADFDVVWRGFTSSDVVLATESRRALLVRHLSRRFCDDSESLSPEASEYLLQFDCPALTADSDEVRLAKEIFGTEQR